jgi:hypothetical protein
MTKKKEASSVKAKLSDVIKTDAVIDMSSIVAFFISKYETSLLTSKKYLSDKIVELTSYLGKEFVSEVEKDIKITNFNITIPILNITAIASITIKEDTLYTQKVITLHVSDSVSSGRHGGYSCLNYQKEVVVSDTVHQKFITTVDEITTLRNSLREVLENLSSVSRKERELRGALAEKTLRASGNSELFEDEALLKLVNLPQLSVKTI